ncbi:MAG: DNA polymerase Y family protein [Burkholderiales bacterium]|nr:DNA polymerase Y family protein [Burkholderiales bacterium]
MLWLAIHLPRLSLEAWAATLPPSQQAQPLALLQGQQILAANDTAAEAGVQPGMKRATALALAPMLLLGQADARRDREALQAVAHAALAFTPSVALEGSATVLLEVATSLRFFGGADALLARLRQALAPLGHCTRIARAPTALGAALLARWQGEADAAAASRQDRQDQQDRQGLQSAQDLAALQRALDAMPITLLDAAREHAPALQAMGLQRLADLRHLPRAGLARRFGQALLDEIDRARGTRPDPRKWLCAPEAFDARLELAARADRADQVLHAAARLLVRLVAWAQARQARVQAFELRMQHEPRHRADEATPTATLLRIELAEPAAELAQLQALLRERLARVQLAAPTLELRLHCHEWVQQPPPNTELFPTRQSERSGLVRLLERLRARLGNEQVLQLQTVADHRPERSVRTLPWGVQLADPPRPVPPPAPRPRPIWLLPTPAPLPERRAMPWFEGGPLQLLAGPERIESGWWDGGLAARDYFIAQAADGSLLWIYRARLPVADPLQPLWFLQGRFG